ncbi:MAG: hypothetical protein ACOYBP_08915 [Microbacteriaceae bacterium]
MRNYPALVEHVRAYCQALSADVDVQLTRDVETLASKDGRPRMLFSFGDTTGDLGKSSWGSPEYADATTEGFASMLESWTCLVTAYDRSDINDHVKQYEACAAMRDLLLSAIDRCGFQVEVLRQNLVARSKSFSHGLGIRVTGTILQDIRHTIESETTVFPWKLDQVTEVDGQDIEVLQDLPSPETDPNQ